MTHDELLAKIDEQITTWSSEEYGWPKQWLSDEVKSKTPMASYFKALRAVVELCREYETQYIGGEYGPEYEWGGMEALDKVIQAIEKELK